MSQIKQKIFPSIMEIKDILLTFMLTTFAWIVFRSDSVSGALKYISNIFLKFDVPRYQILQGEHISIIGIILMVIVEWFNRDATHGLYNIANKRSKIIRYLVYYSIVMITMLLFPLISQKFIYFQF